MDTRIRKPSSAAKTPAKKPVAASPISSQNPTPSKSTATQKKTTSTTAEAASQFLSPRTPHPNQINVKRHRFQQLSRGSLSQHPLSVHEPKPSSSSSIDIQSSIGGNKNIIMGGGGLGSGPASPVSRLSKATASLSLKSKSLDSFAKPRSPVPALSLAATKKKVPAISLQDQLESGKFQLSMHNLLLCRIALKPCLNP